MQLTIRDVEAIAWSRARVANPGAAQAVIVASMRRFFSIIVLECTDAIGAFNVPGQPPNNYAPDHHHPFPQVPPPEAEEEYEPNEPMLQDPLEMNDDVVSVASSEIPSDSESDISYGSDTDPEE